ncbi:MAG: DUF2779 domain-containing protein [Gemmatimonadota bacterium]|nr:MAG: DUF2779 domain-containing protein [Gemmatimonadota bacterium]
MYSKGTPTLSKSRFLSGLQCPLRLWFECYAPVLAGESSLAQKARMEIGQDVGRLATELYPGGELIEEDHVHHEDAVRTTNATMTFSDVPAIFQAAFLHDDIRIRTDILEKFDRNRWNLIEVKSGVKVKADYLYDLGIQYYVLKGSGLDINQTCIMHLNGDYVYNGFQLDVRDFFHFQDLTDHVVSIQSKIPSELSKQKEILARPEPPHMIPSLSCKPSNNCEFRTHCAKDLPDYPVIELPGLTQAKWDALAELGTLSIRDIPDSFPLSELQQRVRTCVITEEEHVDMTLQTELTDIEFPIHFLDFETMGPTIPYYAGTSPYQTIPFQWSDHILFKDGSLEPRHFLWDERTDPREEFIRSLLETLGQVSTIFIYTDYEKNILKGLSEQFPDYHGPLLATLDRMKDLCAIVRTHYYHPKFHGSFSLKSVLPVLVPDMRYDDLAIQEGEQASLEYMRMIEPSTPSEEKKKIRLNLISYCGQDTLAMVKIREELLGRA